MIIEIIAWIFIVATLIYFLVLLLTRYGLARLEDYPPVFDKYVSIVIAFRNERENLPDLLDSLEQLTYPASLLEIIFANDGSSDGGERLVEERLTEHSNWRLLQIKDKPEGLKGKKYAITKAVRSSRGELILTTDADCIVPPHWVETMVGCLREQDGMVIGHSPLLPKKGFGYLLQEFDNLCGAVIAAAGAYFNKPPHSNGRNLLYRRSAFLEVDGYLDNGHIDSGDDFFLSKSIMTRTSYTFNACLNPESYVYTKPVTMGSRLFHQQMRRDGKVFYLSPMLFFFAFAIALHILLLPFFLLASIGIILKIAFILLKVLLEYFTLRFASRRFHNPALAKWYPLMALIYPVYVFLFALLGSLRFYRWK